MHDLFRVTLPLYFLLAVCIVIALQNAGIVVPYRQRTTPVSIADSVDVEVGNTVAVDVNNTVDVNLSEVVGAELVQSQTGMFIGVSSTKNTIIPINWGEISISRLVVRSVYTTAPAA